MEEKDDNYVTLKEEEENEAEPGVAEVEKFAMIAKISEAKAANVFDAFTCIASIYYIREAWRIKGWKPFTA